MATILINEPSSNAASGYEDPGSMLVTCHQRVTRMCALLERLHQHLTHAGVDQQARSAATDVMRYFDIAAPLHYEDEELHVLPRLQASGNTADRELAQVILDQHQAMTNLWKKLRPQLQAIAQLGQADAFLSDPIWQEFTKMHYDHIILEEEHVFPDVFPTIEATDLQKIGKEMAKRRGLPE